MMLRMLALSTFPLLAMACGDDEELVGSITATAYGEEFIEEGIPASVFADGWAVQFDKFVVSIGDPKAKAGEGAKEVGDPGMYLVDLAQPSNGEGYAFATFDAFAGTYDHYGYRIAPSGDAVAINASEADAAAMKQRGYSIWVQGTATKGGVEKSFDWGFSLKLAHAHCDVMETIRDQAITVQSTIHADHLFYDDAVSEDPNVAFELIATADADDDGTITTDELAATDIRAQTRYQVGSRRDPHGNAITNLLQYIELQATSLGHLNGEGHCEDVVVTP